MNLETTVRYRTSQLRFVVDDSDSSVRRIYYVYNFDGARHAAELLYSDIWKPCPWDWAFYLQTNEIAASWVVFERVQTLPPNETQFPGQFDFNVELIRMLMRGDRSNAKLEIKNIGPDFRLLAVEPDNG